MTPHFTGDDLSFSYVTNTCRHGLIILSCMLIIFYGLPQGIKSPHDIMLYSISRALERDRISLRYDCARQTSTAKRVFCAQ